MVSIGVLSRLHLLDLIPSSRCDPKIRHPGGEGELHNAPRPRCYGNRSGAIWGTFDCYGRDEEHHANLSPASVQQDNHPSTVQVGRFDSLTMVPEC